MARVSIWPTAHAAADPGSALFEGQYQAAASKIQPGRKRRLARPLCAIAPPDFGAVPVELRPRGRKNAIGRGNPGQPRP